MSGSRKNALVTGGTDGVGKEVARGLALAGHRVVLVGRDAGKGARVEREMRETVIGLGDRDSIHPRRLRPGRW